MPAFDLDDFGPDFHLLKNGPVHLFHRQEALDGVTATLDGLGYLLHRFDASRWDTRDAFAADVKKELDFPDHFGGNLDAFNDCLRDVAMYSYGADRDTKGTVLVFANYDVFAAHDPRAAQVVLDIVADNARFAMLFGHRMACLVQSGDPGLSFTPVGATAVNLQS